MILISITPTHIEGVGGRGGVLVGAVVEEKVGELEEEVREGFYKWLRKDLTGVVPGVSGKRRFLARFQYWREKDLTLNQLTVMTVYKIPVDEEPMVPTISGIPDETFDSEKGCYHGVYFMQNLRSRVV